ncbi:TolC family protein [Alteromonas pelagimontana]|uniref:TolC family protein n=1 Tax=Alteromonas pelagimontana TaxID=1858656 RepID=A0A6M4MDP6_9ALTE|nr:TolC family protein [Alteromonas pelagimontana]QJR81311.1 TolC family protein [Alteromonas pelagimontana]
MGIGLRKTRACYACVLLIFSLLAPAATAAVLHLNDAIKLAYQHDPWLAGSRYRQQAMAQQSIAAGTLADPTVALSVANLPMDTWDFDQEAMTQVKVGVSQMFPRGRSLEIKRAGLQLEAAQFPYLRQDRKAKVAVNVAEFWLDAWLAQQTITLIERDKFLFEQLAEIANAQYANVTGNVRQQDVIRSQLELVQLDDRLTLARQQYQTALAKLEEWIANVDQADRLTLSSESSWQLPELLPEITLGYSNAEKKDTSVEALVATFNNHPSLKAIENQIAAATTDIALAQEQYKPQWGVNASYGYRDNSPQGIERADFFSVGLTVDVPLFTDNRQDKMVSSAIASAEAVKTDKRLMLKSMLAQFQALHQQLKGLHRRQALYQEQLLPQIHEQAETALTAYTNSEGDFAEVVRARIAELNARIIATGIDVDILKTRSRINYFFVEAEPVAIWQGEH